MDNDNPSFQNLGKGSSSRRNNIVVFLSGVGSRWLAIERREIWAGA